MQKYSAFLYNMSTILSCYNVILTFWNFANLKYSKYPSMQPRSYKLSNKVKVI